MIDVGLPRRPRDADLTGSTPPLSCIHHSLQETVDHYRMSGSSGSSGDDISELIGDLPSEDGNSFKPNDTEDDVDDEHEEEKESAKEEETEEKEERDEEEEDTEEPEEGREDNDETVTMRTHNVTELMKNHTFITEDDVDISFMQECKAKEADKGRLKE